MFHSTHGSNEAPYTSASNDYGTLRTNADSWLKTHLDGYVQWAKTHNSLLIVTWDEGDERLRGPQGNHIPTIFVGPMVRPGRYAEPINHLNVLRTIEDADSLPPLGKSADAASIKGVWSQ